MANFLNTSADTEQRLGEYAGRLFRVEAHIRKGEMRAARARLDGFVDELDAFAVEMELPLETVVVGAQLGFFSGSPLIRGRLPAALVGATAGWLFGQHVIQRHRIFLDQLVDRTSELYEVLFQAERAELEARMEAAAKN